MTKKRKTFTILAVIFAIIGILSLLFSTMGKAADTATDITREYKYTSLAADEKPEVETPIVENGVSYEYVEDETEITVNGETPFYTETVELTGLSAQQAPETKEFEVNGNTVTLMLLSAEYSEDGGHGYEAETTVEYPGLTVQPAIPDTADVIYTNGKGENITVEGTLKNVTESDSYWTTIQIPATVELPAGANAFLYGDKIIAYNDASPLWDGYQSDVLAAAGYSSANTRVSGGYWNGGFYSANGANCRDIIFTAEAYVTDYTAVYAASGDAEGFSATAVYGAPVADIGLSDADANASQYDLMAVAHYRISEIAANGGFSTLSSSKIVFPAITVVSCIGFVASLFVLIFFCKERKDAWKRNGDNDEGEDNAD